MFASVTVSEDAGSYITNLKDTARAAGLSGIRGPDTERRHAITRHHAAASLKSVPPAARTPENFPSRLRVSRHTIADIRRQHNLRITVGDVKISDILENIEILFGDVDLGDYGRVCITLSQDEIVGDGRLCYLEETDEIGGLCEYASAKLKTFKMGEDLMSVEETVRNVDPDSLNNVTF
ncbi:hypothetical protein C8J57DRAFT_1223067 [Mycena rebaudengoi]|nr:hypothetical protein C8J57DRAFT_1223067 [Mycena rebaudengoi]